jgi:hypothetical protein
LERKPKPRSIGGDLFITPKKRMVGASQIASASAASFMPRFSMSRVEGWRAGVARGSRPRLEQVYTRGIGRFEDGRIAELFTNGAKVGETNAQDAAIVASLALQHGCLVETILHALVRSGGSAGPL